MVRLVGLALLLAVVGAGCTSADDASEPGLPTLGAPFSCGEPIDAFDDLPEGYRAVGEVVAFPTEELLQRGRTGPDNDPGSARSFSKLGLVVRAGAVFQIHVAGDSQANALLHWGNTGPNDPVSSIAVPGCEGTCDSLVQPGCPDGEDRDWVVYPGGLWTLEPACVSLIVLTGAERAVVDLPAGERCG